MKENYHKKNSEFSNNELDLRELFKILLEGKWFISIFTFLASVSVLIYTLALPNIYQSQAILVPVQPKDTISGAISSYSGLASLAGVSLPSQADDNNVQKAIQKISSLSFFENNILPNIFLPELMAVGSWDPINNILTFDDGIYDESTNSWVRESSFPKTPMPTSQESFTKFKLEHLIINEDKKTGFVTLAINHQSPHVAKKWVELVIDQINLFYRDKDKEDAQKAISFLNTQIATTNFAEIKQVIASLMQQETQKLTLIEVNESYVFSYIDPPAVMEEKHGPNRAIICILIAIFGFIFGILFVLIKHYGFTRID